MVLLTHLSAAASVTAASSFLVGGSCWVDWDSCLLAFGCCSDASFLFLTSLIVLLPVTSGLSLTNPLTVASFSWIQVLQLVHYIYYKNEITTSMQDEWRRTDMQTDTHIHTQFVHLFNQLIFPCSVWRSTRTLLETAWIGSYRLDNLTKTQQTVLKHWIWYFNNKQWYKTHTQAYMYYNVNIIQRLWKETWCNRHYEYNVLVCQYRQEWEAPLLLLIDSCQQSPDTRNTTNSSISRLGVQTFYTT